MLKDYKMPFRNLYDTLSESAKKYPDKPAVIDDQETVSYRELLERADLLAALMKNRYSLQEQEQIGILMSNSANAVAVFYAAMKLGCIALMINTKFREQEILGYLNSMEARVLFCDERWESKALEPAKRLQIPAVIVDQLHLEREVPDKTIRSVQNADDTAVIMHTSGTTGNPKGVMVTQKNILEAAYGYQEVQRLDHTAVTVLSVPLFHILGLSCVTTHFIYMGATIVLSAFYHVEDVLRKIKKYRATHFHSVPTIYLQIIESEYPEKDLSSLRTAVCGGAPISRENMDAFCRLAPNAVLHLAYGMTETAGSGTLSAVHKGALMAVPNVEMKVVDRMHRELPPGEVGELVGGGKRAGQQQVGDLLVAEAALALGGLDQVADVVAAIAQVALVGLDAAVDAAVAVDVRDRGEADQDARAVGVAQAALDVVRGVEPRVDVVDGAAALVEEARGVADAHAL